MKIKYKLSSIIFFVIILVSVASYELFTATFETQLTKRLETAEVVFATGLAEKLVRPLIENNQSAVIAALMKEKQLQHNKIDYLLVFDLKGRLFSHTYLTPIPQSVYTLNNSFNVDEPSRIDYLEDTELHAYNISVPIKEGILQVGTLHVGIGMDFIAETATPLKKASKKIFLLALVITLFGGILALLVSHALTQSLTQLEEWAEKLSEEDYSAEIRLDTKDEIAHLASSFKKMRDKIQTAHQALAEQNETLEQTVAERTAELASSHQELLNQNVLLEKLAHDLEQERKNLKIVFSAMDYPLFVVNLDYTIEMMNDKAQEKAQRYSDTNLCICHQAAYGLPGPCNHKLGNCPMPEVVKTKKPVTLEHRYETETGEQIVMEIRAFPIFDLQGEVVQIVESFIDISDKKLAEEENLQLERQLNRAAKMESIGTLAAGIAHEINTPIQFIGDNTNFAADGVKDLFTIIDNYKKLLKEAGEGQQDFTGRMEEIDDAWDLDYLIEELPNALSQTSDGISHVAGIVKAMKDFSHIGKEDAMAPADLNQAIKTTLMISKNEWKYDADIIENLSTDLPMALCQIGEIKQVLLNLVVNAAHAISKKHKNSDERSAKGTITISTSHSDGVIQVAIADTGTGIADEYKNRIFDHFFTTKEVGKGSGQGLSIAYQVLVDVHGQKLWFETEPGKGTTFFFTLQAA